MNFRLKIELGNEAMQSGADVAAVLRELAARLQDESGPPPRGPVSLYDLNGNRVGFYETTGRRES